MSLLLTALKFAPSVLAAGRDIYSAVTGEAAAETPAALAAAVESLAPEQRQQITEQIIAAKLRAQELDTQRFQSLTDGDAEKIRSTARPQIALRAMAMMETFSRVFTWLIIATLVQWGVRLLADVAGLDLEIPSIWAEIAKIEPVAEMIWGPLLLSIYAAIDVIKKYMGCRERDKARADEMAHGRPLQSTAATVEAAGSSIAGIVRAMRK